MNTSRTGKCYDDGWAARSLGDIDHLLDIAGIECVPDFDPDADIDKLDIGEIVYARLANHLRPFLAEYERANGRMND